MYGFYMAAYHHTVIAGLIYYINSIVIAIAIVSYIAHVAYSAFGRTVFCICNYSYMHNYISEHEH